MAVKATVGSRGHPWDGGRAMVGQGEDRQGSAGEASEATARTGPHLVAGKLSMG